ncbi:hypothetical protein V6N11_060955 [Hibiscus sabdariffa]|uniref:Disease resistance R13L4/SHOC-2-like LRR domain-containing protein n=1 Tax=Hibiscus sabdariffa TaxID=183260 RepID=A0ABR2QRR2_9ROSI
MILKQHLVHNIILQLLLIFRLSSLISSSSWSGLPNLLAHQLPHLLLDIHVYSQQISVSLSPGTCLDMKYEAKFEISTHLHIALSLLLLLLSPLLPRHLEARVSAFLKTLETLDLIYCTGLEELPKDIRYLISLRALWITRQTSLQGSGIECLASLQKLVIWGCENLKELFEDMQSLTALRTLRIVECNNLISLPQGLKCLTSLEILEIKDCMKLDLCMELELGGKEDGNLRKLFVEGLPMVESLPRWIVLGSTKTLQRLQISRLENLSKLPSWFQHLTALKDLKD